MAGVKGKSGGPRSNAGGARPGAGRPRKTPAATPAGVTGPAPADTPLDFLKGVMNDTLLDPKLRVRAAIAAAQYEHSKVGEGGKKDERQRAAKAAGQGRFAPAAPPKLVVSNK